MAQYVDGATPEFRKVYSLLVQHKGNLITALETAYDHGVSTNEHLWEEAVFMYQRLHGAPVE